MKTSLTLSILSLSVAAQAALVNFDAGWSFRLEGETKARPVLIPHDWSVEGAPSVTESSGPGMGFYPTGIGIYTKTFTLTEEEAKRPLKLVFDGVYRKAAVFFNDDSEAIHGSRYGYTGFEAPIKKPRVGTNTVKVVVDNSEQPNCRWYSGSGIFRHVWLDDGTPSAPRAPVVYPKVEWSDEKGLLVDGKPTVLHGACVHHDHGPLGAASWDEAEIRKVRQLKAAGFNAVRTSHNPVSEAFLTACDQEGLLVMDDIFDGWRVPKNPHDYHTVFDADWEKDLRWTLQRDARHPSVILWSVGNEIIERTTPEAAEQAGRMVALCHQLDPAKRPVTQAQCSWGGRPQWQAQDAMAAQMDIVGYNYMQEETEIDHARHPARVMVYTETFPNDAAKIWRLITKHSFVIGEFVWTGIDYLGEASIGRTYYATVEPEGEHYAMKPAFPWHGAYCGDIDITGWRKPISHYRETLWNETAPTYLATCEPDGWKGTIRGTSWSVWPTWESWTYGGWEGKPVTVEVYSRRRHVTLKLNGEVVGEAENGEANAYKTRFEVPYQPGELVAEGWDTANGARETSVLRTAGAMDHIRFSEETIGRLTWITAEVVDKNGTVCPDAAIEVTFDGNILATCSADMTDNVPAPSKTRRTWHGRAMAVRLNADK